MTHTKLVAVALAVFSLGTSAQALTGDSTTLREGLGLPPVLLAQSNCPSGTTPCAAGSYGPGGCYKPGYATCTAGLVCTDGMSACKPTNGGPAYCFKAGIGSCN